MKLEAMRYIGLPESLAESLGQASPGLQGVEHLAQSLCQRASEQSHVSTRKLMRTASMNYVLPRSGWQTIAHLPDEAGDMVGAQGVVHTMQRSGLLPS